MVEELTGRNVMYLNSESVSHYHQDQEAFLNQGLLLQVVDIKQIEHRPTNQNIHLIRLSYSESISRRFLFKKQFIQFITFVALMALQILNYYILWNSKLYYTIQGKEPIGAQSPENDKNPHTLILLQIENYSFPAFYLV